MKTYIVNIHTDERTQVVRKQLDNEPVWFDINNNSVVAKVYDMPDNCKLEFDCSEERKALGQHIRAERLNQGYNTPQFSAACGITRANLQKAEEGDVSVGFDVLVRMLSVLNLTISIPPTAPAAV